MMKMSPLKTILAIAVLLLSVPAMAADQQTSTGLMQSSLSAAMDLIFNDLQNWCVKVLALFMLIQFTWTNINLLLEGADLSKVWAKFIGSMFWFGICFYTFENGSDFIKTISNFLLQKASSASGAPFEPSYPIDTGIGIASAMLEALDGSQSILSSLNPFPSIMMGIVSIGILAVSAVIAFKVFMIFIETKIVIALSPISFSLLGLNALKDQGLAPLKYLISLAYRVMIISAILTAMGALGHSIVDSFQSLPSANDASVWPPIWAAGLGFSLLGAFAWKSDSIAAMLASGSSNMSPGDAAAVGAVAGAAMAAAVTGGMSAAGAASGAAKRGQSMGEFMKQLSSVGGEVKNASSSGVGGQQPVGEVPRKPNLSTKEGEYAMGKNRFPIRPPESPVAATESMPTESTSGKDSPAQSNQGSETNAGISGGSGSGMEKQLGDLVSALSQPKKATFADRLGTLNDHVAREQSTVQAHVNVNANDH